MIPGTIEEWKKALNESGPGKERAACVYALLTIGVCVERKSEYSESWTPSPAQGMNFEYRVKPTPRPWNAEDARRHVGFAYRTSARIGIIGILPSGELSCGTDSSYWDDWEGDEYATPIPGTDPSTWNWQKCEVVE